MSLACLDIPIPDTLNGHIIEASKSQYAFIFEISAMML